MAVGSRKLPVRRAHEMELLGAALARGGRRGQSVFLHGPLAAGKTTLARGYLRALGHRGAVKSPTFTLVESYALDGGVAVHHFDLYRLAAAEELEFIGPEEYLDAGADVLVEWAERGRGVLPPATLEVCIEVADDGRAVTLSGSPEAGPEVLSRIACLYESYR